jgi:hypothetical protein
MFTKHQVEIIEGDFKEVESLAAGRREELFGIFSKCTDEEVLCLKFLYSNMPISDLTNYDGSLFLKHVRHCLKVKGIAPWGKNIDTEAFINFVLPLRVNNENLDFYGETMFNEIYPRVKDLDMYHAALEVNYWCYEKATYTTSDMRTVSPLTMLRNTLGRCGEESTFTVAALRSVGIPARQCYTPRWSHSDDNHAWVEVQVDGEWHFLGACEPEPVLDKGWFEHPASRCMLTHSRVFSKLITSDSILSKTPKITEINSLSTYAKTRRITVYVHEGEKPVSGAIVRFEIVNYAELFPLAELKTAGDGCVSFLTGYGELFIHVMKEGRYCYGKIDVRETERVSIDFTNAYESISGNMEFHIVPPSGVSSMEHGISPELEGEHNKRVQYGEELRRKYQKTFYNQDTVKTAAERHGEYAPNIAEALVNAKGNYKEIEAFLGSNENKNIKWKSAMLGTLNKKDFGDVTAQVLLEHLKSALEYKDCFDEEIFVKYILCPRTYYEMLTPYRQDIKEILGDELLEGFRKEPVKVGEYVKSTIEKYDNLDYNVLYAAPDKLLKMGKGSTQSQKLLMVAICRTAGIPSRLNPTDLTVEYYREGAWYMMEGKPAEQARNCSLILRAAQEGVEFKYMSNYSVAVLSEGAYHTLHIKNDVWEDHSVRFMVVPGNYRILTTNRLENGTVLANAYHVELKEEESAEVEIELRKLEIDRKQGSLGKLEDFSLTAEVGEHTTLAEELSEGPNVIAWLEVGKEPTEHLLNEILEHTDEYNGVSCEVVFIISDASKLHNDTLRKVQEEVPSIRVYIDNNNSLNDKLYKDINTKDRRMPLAVVGDKELNIYYISTGYNIGSAEALLKNIKSWQKV